MRRFFPVLPVLTCLLAAGRAFPQEHGSVSASDGSHASTTIGSLTTVAQIRALSASESAQSHAVELHAVLTYYQPTQGQVFVQDATGGIYVVPPANPPSLQPGDAVVVRGTTVPSFATNVRATELKADSGGHFPVPVPLSWQEILQRSNDCRYVSITGVVRSATDQVAAGQTAVTAIRRREGAPAQTAEAANAETSYLLIDLQMDGGSVRVHMQEPGAINPLSLLDAQVRFDGVAGGLFDGKFQQLGAELWVSSAAHMQVLKPAPDNPANLPLTEIGRIESNSYVRDQSQRVHVRGSVTLYQPGLQLVVETPGRQAVLVNTYEQSPLQVGQVVDVVGFPNPHQYAQDYSESIGQANVLPTQQIRPITPITAPWDEAMAGNYPYDLISMEGTLAAEVRERHQDFLVIQMGSHVFSAMLPRTVWNQDFDQMSLPEYRIGSRVRVTGVCYVHAGGPWSTPRWFELEMRSPADVVVLADPSWWTVRHLLYLSAALVALMLGALIWAFLLQSQVRSQSEQIRVTMESEAARERRIAFMEKERGHVLEAINSKQNLEEVLLMILHLISRQLGDRACWCELPNGTRVGSPATEKGSPPGIHRDIFSSVGERLGSLVLAGVNASNSHAGEVMEMGASLAALAIDNRRLYETLVHRSQYDQLTNAANRFLLENRLDEVIACAGRNASRFALIYIDLNQFKAVNDLYGHRVGDVYLQQVTQRFSENLRGMDTLARVGGDEFIALIPAARSRSEVEEIAHRLLRCFDKPFSIEANEIRGSASIGIAIYPENGRTKEELKRFADAAMYANKPAVRH
ncbi:MAG TPA: GGDEF domain-containing protein [Acidobacteriaceae bacterium]|nr:GGDEF domain-containing protein [Acidobacteriaceae bacterium]